MFFSSYSCYLFDLEDRSEFQNEIVVLEMLDDGSLFHLLQQELT